MSQQATHYDVPRWGFWKVVFAGVFIIVLSTLTLKALPIALDKMAGSSLNDMFNSAKAVVGVKKK